MPLITTTLEASPAITQGLSTGAYTRWGGVVREAETGRQVAHLQEVGQGVNQLQEGLRHLTGMAQLAAGASILNLGVSAVGFAVMSRKLNQLGQSLDQLRSEVQVGFEDMHGRFDRVDQQLGYLVVLAEDQRFRQQILQRDMTRLIQHSVAESFAEVLAELQARQRFGPSGDRQSITTLSRLSGQLQAKALSFGRSLEPDTMLNVDMCLQGWVAAATMEADELYLLRRHEDAAKVLANLDAATNSLAEAWTTAVLNDEAQEPLQTALRFAIGPLNSGIQRERVERISRHSPRDRDVDSILSGRRRRDATVQADMSGHSDDPTWIGRQIATASYLDLLAETADRAATRHLLAVERESDNGQLDRATAQLERAGDGVYVIADSELITS